MPRSDQQEFVFDAVELPTAEQREAAAAAVKGDDGYPVLQGSWSISKRIHAVALLLATREAEARADERRKVFEEFQRMADERLQEQIDAYVLHLNASKQDTP